MMWTGHVEVEGNIKELVSGRFALRELLVRDLGGGLFDRVRHRLHLPWTINVHIVLFTALEKTEGTLEFVVLDEVAQVGGELLHFHPLLGEGVGVEGAEDGEGVEHHHLLHVRNERAYPIARFHLPISLCAIELQRTGEKPIQGRPWERRGQTRGSS